MRPWCGGRKAAWGDEWCPDRRTNRLTFHAQTILGCMRSQYQFYRSFKESYVDACDNVHVDDDDADGDDDVVDDAAVDVGVQDVGDGNVMTLMMMVWVMLMISIMILMVVLSMCLQY